jgi:DHA2 family methylenomycin A resistance protein-like MFS transporter
MSSVPAGQSGLGSGLQNTTRQTGALIAVSVLGSVLSTGFGAGPLAAAFVLVGLAGVAGTMAGLVAVREVTPRTAVPVAAPE